MTRIEPSGAAGRSPFRWCRSPRLRRGDRLTPAPNCCDDGDHKIALLASYISGAAIERAGGEANAMAAASSTRPKGGLQSMVETPLQICCRMQNRRSPDQFLVAVIVAVFGAPPRFDHAANRCCRRTAP